VAATQSPTKAVDRRAPAAPADVVVHGLHKTFRLPRRRYHTLKERVLHPRAAREYDLLPALAEVSFEVGRGEFFGIVGRNGSGKSTLLKCLAGIYAVDAGEVEVRGRLSPFIELGVGFNPDLAARDNVIINAIMLGMTRREARASFDDVVAFAELEDFLDLKLKNYSSGMLVRLAFASAIQVDAEVLLVDEVLAVGDAAFQRKCFEEFERMKAAGRTIVFVTHDMSAVQRFCDRAMLLDQGEVLEIGQPGQIARRYQELNFGRLPRVRGTTVAEDVGPVGGPPPAEIVAGWFEDAAGERAIAIRVGEACALCYEVEFHAPVQDPVFSLLLRNDVRHTVFATSSRREDGAAASYAPGDRVTVRVALEMWLAPVSYTLSPVVLDEPGGAPIDAREDLATLIVNGDDNGGALTALPHDLRVERA
jgi:ABC-type polysaccharide/polyol phosphate transport system ATPase subunit